MSSPDYRYILIRLLDKIRRSQNYYNATVSLLEAKSRRGDIPRDEHIIATARCDSVSRCASDLGYAFDRATEKLTAEDIREIESFNKQEYHDRHHSLSEPSRPSPSRPTLHQQPGGSRLDG